MNALYVNAMDSLWSIRRVCSISASSWLFIVRPPVYGLNPKWIHAIFGRKKSIYRSFLISFISLLLYIDYQSGLKMSQYWVDHNISLAVYLKLLLKYSHSTKYHRNPPNFSIGIKWWMTELLWMILITEVHLNYYLRPIHHISDEPWYKQLAFLCAALRRTKMNSSITTRAHF